MPSNDPGEVLSRYPGPVVLPPSRTKWLLVMLGCAAFTATGLFTMPKGETLTWAAIVFFGMGTLIALVMLLPGAGGLTLNREGFEMISLFRKHFVPWPEATGFIAKKIPRARKKMVFFDDARAKKNALGQFNVSLVGRNAGVPDTYGFTAEDLASLMAQWREQAVARQ